VFSPGTEIPCVYVLATSIVAEIEKFLVRGVEVFETAHRLVRVEHHGLKVSPVVFCDKGRVGILLEDERSHFSMVVMDVC
jgi:hypothetical protein